MARAFVFGSREQKIRRVIGHGIHEKEASELVDTIDQERASFVRKYFNAEWPCRHLYHMMLNSDPGIELVTESILHFMDGIEAARNYSDHAQHSHSEPVHRNVM